MARVYSTQFAMGSAIGGTSGVIFAAEDGYVSVVREVTLALVSGTAPSTLQGEITGPGFGFIAFYHQLLALQAGDIIPMRLVMNAGQVLTVGNFQTSRVDVVISGYKLSLP